MLEIAKKKNDIVATNVAVTLSELTPDPVNCKLQFDVIITVVPSKQQNSCNSCMLTRNLKTNKLINVL